MRSSWPRIQHLAIIGFAVASCDSRHDVKIGGAPAATLSADQAVRVKIPNGSPANELSRLVLGALPRTARTCLVVWGDYRGPGDKVSIVFEGPDGGTIGRVPSWLTCPSPDAADFVSNFGDDRVKLVGLAFFRVNHFEFKAPTGPEARLTGALRVTPESGTASNLLSRMSDLSEMALFSYLRVDQ